MNTSIYPAHGHEHSLCSRTRAFTLPMDPSIHALLCFQHWQLPLGRRFRSIKLWFTLRMIGVEGLRHHIRLGVEKAKHFENLIRSHQNFQVVFPVTLGLVCFRMVVPDKSNQVNCKEVIKKKIMEFAHEAGPVLGA